MTDADRTIDTVGLARHPKPRDLAKEAREFARLCESDLGKAIRLSTLFAARGWAGGTLGDGTGSRTSDVTSSVERAAGVTQETLPALLRLPRFADADRMLAAYLAVIEQAMGKVSKLAGDLLAHADDADVIPAGTGGCECCSRFCKPDVEHPDNRLRSGFCPACYKAWGKSGRPERGLWIIERRAWLKAAVKSGKTPAELTSAEAEAS